MTKQWIGIDVSKKRLDIYIGPIGEAFSGDNTPAAIAQLVERLKTKNPTLVVLEATQILEQLQTCVYTVALITEGCPEGTG